MSRTIFIITETCEVNLSGNRGRKTLERGSFVDYVGKYWVPDSADFGDYCEDFYTVIFCAYGLAKILNSHIKEV